MAVILNEDDYYWTLIRIDELMATLKLTKKQVLELDELMAAVMKYEEDMI